VVGGLACIAAVFCAIFTEQSVSQDVKERIGLAVVVDAALTQPFLYTLDRVTSPLPLAHATPTAQHFHTAQRPQSRNLCQKSRDGSQRILQIARTI